MRTTRAAYHGRSLLMRLGPYVIGCWMAFACDEGTLQASAPSAGTSAGRSAAVPPGTLDTDNRYAATVRVYLETAKGHKKDIACSGTVIDPRLVLTAAHCVCRSAASSPGRRESRGRTITTIVTASDCAKRATVMTVRYPPTGPDPKPIKREYEGDVQAHPAAELLFDGETAFRVKADLAVIVLDKEVKGIAPVKLADAEVEEGDGIILVGYGTSSETSPERRVGENEVSKVRKPVLGGVEFVASAQHLKDGGVASQVIHGDSGGSCFKLKVDGPRVFLVLVGVNASTAVNAWGEVSSIFTSVHAYKDWLEPMIKEVNAGREPP